MLYFYTNIFTRGEKKELNDLISFQENRPEGLMKCVRIFPLTENIQKVFGQLFSCLLLIK